ncbi:MAG TPA: N-acetyltransferase [Ignavibacteria bacterium]|nr:N-acetyltransferase [Ignavibacteria bacterium]HMQ97646.1 N-acetyltransferase [Ignavibacteria bacterium]
MRDQWAKELYVRGEKAADYDAITEINRLAFGRDDEGILINDIRKTRSYEFGFSLVAIKEDVILGHVLFSKGFITHRGRRFKCLVLGPVAVHPEHQRHGIGKALINEGLERAKEVGFGAVIVVGDPVYYAQFGFKPAVTMKLRTSMKIPDENFMAKEISRNALRGIIGTVMFPREFLTLAEADKKRADEKAKLDEQARLEETIMQEARDIASNTFGKSAAAEKNEDTITEEVTEGEITPEDNTPVNEPVNEEVNDSDETKNSDPGDENSGGGKPEENNTVM